VSHVVRGEEDNAEVRRVVSSDAPFERFNDRLPPTRRVHEDEWLKMETANDKFELISRIFVVSMHHENLPTAWSVPRYASLRWLGGREHRKDRLLKTPLRLRSALKLDRAGLRPPVHDGPVLRSKLWMPVGGLAPSALASRPRDDSFQP